MPVGLVVTEKEVNGEIWSNTWGVGFDIGQVGGLDEASLIALGALIPFTDATTNIGNGGYQGSTHLFHAILGFERQLYPTFVNFARIYVSDGRRNSITAEPLYLSVPLDFQGLRSVSQDATIPGGLTLMVNRIPGQLGVRRGRLYLRSVLGDGDVRFAGNRLVDWTNATVRTAAETLVAGAIANSFLDNFFVSEPNPTEQQYLCIPQFETEGINSGTILDVSPVSGLTVVRPVLRQVQRGRRRTQP